MKKFIGILLTLYLLTFLFGADQEDFPDIYLDESVAPGGVGSQADPYSDFSEINWTTGGDNSIFDWYAGAEDASARILLQMGETWEETLTIGASGSATYPIIIQAYGVGADPIITGRDEISGWDTGGNWTEESPDLWYIGSITTDPHRAFLSDTEYIEAETKGDVNSNERWWYDSGNNRLYVYATENPATAYSSVDGAEIRTYGINVAWKDYITIQDLEIQGGDISINIDTSDYLVIDNCTVGKYAGRFGIFAIGTSGQPSTQGEIKNCTVESDLTNDTLSYRGDLLDGIKLYGDVTYFEVHDNTVSNWNHTCIDLEGINSTRVTQYNEIYDNTISSPNTNYCRGVNFASADTNDGTCAYNKIYHNYIKDTTVRNQIHGNHNEFYYNIIDTVTAGLVTPSAPDGIGLFASGGEKCHDNKIYNNVIYNTTANGIFMYGEGGWGDKEDNLIRNNIIMNWGAAYYGIYMVDDATILGNTWENNCLYKSGVSDVVYYGHDVGNNYPHTIAEFNAENGTAGDVITNNIGGDPKFIDAANDDFRLIMASPCVDAGKDVGLTTDYRGRSIRHAPDIGAYEDPTNALFLSKLFNYLKEKK